MSSSHIRGDTDLTLATTFESKVIKLENDIGKYTALRSANPLYFKSSTIKKIIAVALVLIVLGAAVGLGLQAHIFTDLTHHIAIHANDFHLIDTLGTLGGAAGGYAIFKIGIQATRETIKFLHKRKIEETHKKVFTALKTFVQGLSRYNNEHRPYIEMYDGSAFTINIIAKSSAYTFSLNPSTTESSSTNNQNLFTRLLRFGLLTQPQSPHAPITRESSAPIDIPTNRRGPRTSTPLSTSSVSTGSGSSETTTGSVTASMQRSLNVITSAHMDTLKTTQLQRASEMLLDLFKNYSSQEDAEFNALFTQFKNEVKRAHNLSQNEASAYTAHGFNADKRKLRVLLNHLSNIENTRPENRDSLRIIIARTGKISDSLNSNNIASYTISPVAPSPAPSPSPALTTGSLVHNLFTPSQARTAAGAASASLGRSDLSDRESVASAVEETDSRPVRFQDPTEEIRRYREFRRTIRRIPESRKEVRELFLQLAPSPKDGDEINHEEITRKKAILLDKLSRIKNRFLELKSTRNDIKRGRILLEALVNYQKNIALAASALHKLYPGEYKERELYPIQDEIEEKAKKSILSCAKHFQAIKTQLKNRQTAERYRKAEELFQAQMKKEEEKISPEDFIKTLNTDRKKTKSPLLHEIIQFFDDVISREHISSDNNYKKRADEIRIKVLELRDSNPTQQSYLKDKIRAYCSSLRRCNGAYIDTSLKNELIEFFT